MRRGLLYDLNGQLEMLIVGWIFVTGSVTELALSACSPVT
jgi:hypothetical protein